MYNFFVEDRNITDSEIIINGENYKHINNVLRLKSGEEIQVCNKENGKSYLVKIRDITKENILCNILKETESSEPLIKISVFQGIPKSGKMEYIIQKSVELGAFNIFPVKMKYCVGKINDESKKLKRWQAISESAAKQSKRTHIPIIEKQLDIKELCTKINEYDLVLLAYENEDNETIKDELEKNKNIKSIGIIIGPEGGLSNDEINALTEGGAKCISLGKRILRTETASIALLSMITYEYEL